MCESMLQLSRVPAGKTGGGSQQEPDPYQGTASHELDVAHL